MWQFFLHALECFFWCGVWHYAHHWWHGKKEDHFKDHKRCGDGGHPLTCNCYPDDKYKPWSVMFRNGGMKL